MICDDHEVTDDWNMTRNFCSAVYGSDLGRRIVQNALVAYSLCQAWGNTPEQFDDTATGEPAGLYLLRLLDSNGRVYETQPKIPQLVGVHDDATMQQQPIEYGVYHEGLDAGPTVNVDGKDCPKWSIDYHYTIEGFAHQIIVTDSRTWRSHPRGGDEPPDLIRSFAFKPQIDDAPPLGERLLMVVVTTNMPPIASERWATDHPTTIGMFNGRYASDLYDSWELPSLPFDSMVVHLSSHLSASATDPIAGRIVTMSGDVHFSYAARLQYWAKARLGDQTPRAAKVVFAQLVASAIKNESWKTRALHRGGYEGVLHDGAKGWAERKFVPDWVPEGYAGWNTRSGSLGLDDRTDDETVGWEIVGGQGEGYVVASSNHPTVKITTDEDADEDNTHLYTAPDYHYRLDYLAPQSRGHYPDAPPPLGTVSGSATVVERTNALAKYKKAANAYLNYTQTKVYGKEIVGLNNLAELTFHWGKGDDKKVYHTVRWQQDDKVWWVQYEVSLALDDTTNYPMITAEGE
jgi:hypothetical protein